MSSSKKRNPMANLLRNQQYSHKVIPDKRNSKLEKQHRKEIEHGKTTQDTRQDKDV